jgi:RNA polymerase sigma factor (sigma-70 family)
MSIALVPPPIVSFSSPARPIRWADDGSSVNELPPSLARLVRAESAHDSEAAWRAFLAEHSRLLLHACRTVWRTPDDAMDAYTEILERLRADDFQRLREFARHPRSKASTWLVVVTRRICLDLYRRRYGRRDATVEDRRTRRRLQDLVAERLELHDVSGPESANTDLPVRRSELHDALHEALAELAPSELLLVKLRFVDDLSAAQIAPLLGLPTPFHVYRRLNALLADLKRSLGRRGVESAMP